MPYRTQQTYHSQDPLDLPTTVQKGQRAQRELKSQVEDLKSTVSFFRSSLGNPLVNPPPFSDIVLVASNDFTLQPPFPANRNVLAGHSPVFRAMLENNMYEGIGKTVNFKSYPTLEIDSSRRTIQIGDVSYNTLGLFVSFLYTGEVSNLDEKTAYDLLVLGEKYEIPHLKTYCEKFLISNLNWENSLPLYALARKHSVNLLLSIGVFAFDFKKQHEKDIAET